MDPTQFVVWVFFAIFLFTAVLSLGSLPGWIRLPEYYKKKLFVLLVVEVVGCVCTFGVRIFNSITSAKIALRDTLLIPPYGWDWQYSAQRMRTVLRFQSTKDGKIIMDGTTCVLDAHGNKQQKIEIFKWKSAEPFDIPPNARSVTFRAQREYTPGAALHDPALKWEVGKKVDVAITIHTILGFEGTSIDLDDPASPWGLVMIPAYP